MRVAISHHVSLIWGGFDSVVLNRNAFSLAIEACSDLFADLPVYTPASYRKADYRQFIL